MMKKISVLLVSADAVLRQQWLGVDKAVYELEQAQSVEQAQQWSQHNPNGLLVVDAGLIDIEDAQWQQLLSNPSISVLVGSLSPTDPEGQAMIVAGAKAYFHAYSPVSVMDTMLSSVNTGSVWIGQSLLSRLLSQVSTRLSALTPAPAWQQDLTPRETEVAQRAALGHSNALIASDLAITERTVRAHLSAIFEKLQVTDRLMLTLKVHGIG